MSSPRQMANAIRFLSMDAVQKANSGHPGMPMGMADIAQVLWHEFLSHNPHNPSWMNRDRFVLSNGHGSMLLYSLLHLTGYDLSIEDIKNFRQMHAKTAGHPEFGFAPGIETTTGPLGQGIANAVGMALAQRTLAAEFNQPGHDVINHYTYTFCGDGCLMEGVSHEACSLAGTQKLGKLIVFWDDNGISIDGDVKGWFSDDTAKRFESYGWQVIRDVDGHDHDQIKLATEQARANTEQPTLICCRTTIGFGSPAKAGTAASHGAPLGDDEIAVVRKELDWSAGAFEVPADIKSAWDASSKGEQVQSAWQVKFDAYAAEHPALAAELTRRLQGDLPSNWHDFAQTWLDDVQANGADVATRKASQIALEKAQSVLPELFGGSADLTGSNLTKTAHSTIVEPARHQGNYMFYGVREFGMAAIMNGIALYGGFIPYGGTFLVFADYSRNALRMSALMKQRTVHVLTHDSIGLGEDGPTHQPVEHVASLRMIPNMSVWRPADDVETAASWMASIERKDGPTCLALSRQGLPHLERDAQTLANVRRGGYVLKDTADAKMTLLATGSEVALAMKAAEQLTSEGVNTRVVSMPSVDVFEKQDQVYKMATLSDAPIVAIEAGVKDTWYKYVGRDGAVVGMETFGESAPAGELFKHFGFSVENVVQTAKDVLNEVVV